MSRYEAIQVGDTAEFGKTITEADICAFVAVSGDTNPVHLNEVMASGTMFKRRIAHGMLSAGLISAVLGTKLPGVGTIYLSQTLNFKLPVYIGDTITAKVTVVEKKEKFRLRLLTECFNQDGKVVITGEAEAMLRD